MDIRELFNYKAISKVFNINSGGIRKNKVPKKYKAAIQELYDYVETWVKRHS